MSSLFNTPPPTPTPVGPPPFIPTYEPQPYITNSMDGKRQPLNPDYFVTEPTAIELLKRFVALKVEQRTPGGVGGVFQSDAKERWLIWSDGLTMNAGFLASIYTRNPETTFPNLATKMCWDLIAAMRAQGHST